MSTKIVQVKPLTLNANIGTSNTTAIVSGMIGLDGVDLTQADFGTIIYGTFEPNTTREEAVSFTITSNTGGVANIDFGASGRGLIGKSPYGTGGIPHPHSAGVKLVISNNPNLFNKFTAKDNDEVVSGSWEFPTPVDGDNPATKTYVDTGLATKVALTGDQTVAGVKTFSSSPVVPTPTTNMQAATKKYVDDKAVALTGDQTVAGVKTFSSSPIVPTATTATQAVNKGQVEDYIAANSSDIKASDTAFGTTKLDVPADNIAEPKALTATADRVAALAGGGDFGIPSATNKFLTEEYPYFAANMNFGDGSDGDVTISGTTTLTRDMFYNNLVVNGTLNTDGYRIFVKGTLSGNGTINNNNTTPGGNGQTGGSGGSSGEGGAAGPSKGSGIWKGSPGIIGGTATDGSPQPTTPSSGQNGNKGSSGANGGNGGLGYVGEAGGVGSLGGVLDSTKPIFDKFNALNFAFYSAAATLTQYSIPGSGAGAGGSGRNTLYVGGGGGGSGGSGGIILLFVKNWTGTFTISATGANGGAGGAGLTGGGGGGGGAGGNGGVVVVIYGTKTWTGTYNLTGGLGGAAGAAPSTGGAHTAGTAGANGNIGVAYEYYAGSLL